MRETVKGRKKKKNSAIKILKRVQHEKGKVGTLIWNKRYFIFLAKKKRIYLVKPMQTKLGSL